MKKLAWKQIAVAMVIGFLLGGGFHAWRASQQIPFWMGQHSSRDKERMLQHFSEKLTLTDTQRAQVEKILDSANQQTEILRTEVRPKFQAIRSEMSRSVRSLLTEDQRKRFEAMEADWDARKKRWNSKQTSVSRSIMEPEVNR